MLRKHCYRSSYDNYFLKETHIMDRSMENKNFYSEELRELDNAKAESLAVNINTSLYVLRELGSHNCEDVRRAVVKNPNSSIETVLKLGEYFPEELLMETVFNLIVLVNFYFVGDISYKILLEYAASCENEEIAQIAKLHINLSGEIIEGWKAVVIEAIKIYCSSYKYSYTNIDDFKFIPGNHFKRSDYNFLSYFAEFIPSSILNDKRLRIEVSKNHNTPGKILEQLATDEDELVIKNIAKNTNTPIKILEQFSSKNRYPWTCILGNPNIPLKILKRLKKLNKL